MAMSILSDLETLPEPIHNVGWMDWEEDMDAEIFVKKDQGPESYFILYARGGAERSLSYDVEGPNDFNISGAVDTPGTLYLPETAGVYRLMLESERSIRLFFPLSGPGMNTPEVIRFEESGDGTAAPATSLGYWFNVPEGTEEFWIDFTSVPQPRAYVNRVSVWDPDGERVWDLSYSREDDPMSPPRVTIPVPAGHDGKLWRATGGSFRIDPKIPPLLFARQGRQQWNTFHAALSCPFEQIGELFLRQKVKLGYN